MSSFRKIERSFPGQHIREYPQAISTFQEDVLHLSVNQYIPLNYSPQPNDVTIIAAQAVAFPKELYEPLWEDLLAQSKSAGNWGIKSIWMADCANQGGSYILNEEKTGNDPNFADYARDMLAMVNHFRAEMPRPLIGIGHSMGASALVNLAYLHPRLLSSIICIDPVIPFKPTEALWPMLRLPSFRKDYWPSLEAATEAFEKNQIVKRFDRRVVDRVLKHSIRPLPTLLHPEPKADHQSGDDDERKGKQKQAYTLTTPKHQEAVSIARPNYKDIGVTNTPTPEDRVTHPDIWPDAGYKSPFYKTEGRTCWMFLPHLRPPVFWLYGGDSYAAIPEERRLKMERTGAGWNGSGGAAANRVKESIVPGSGHFVCFEQVEACAREMSGYLDEEIKWWREMEERSVADEWKRRDKVGRQVLDETWMKEVKHWKGQRDVSGGAGGRDSKL